MDENEPLAILFADTDLAATRPLRVELRRRGALVHFVDSSAEAVHQASLEPPDLVVLDGNLRKDGEADLVSFFHSRLPETKIILLHSDVDAPASGPGSGVLFSACKPVSKATLLEVIVSAFPGRLKDGSVPPPETHTVLCVDDDTAYLHSLARFLKRRGYKVHCYESAKSALEAFREIDPHLAVVDILMPGMDGLVLTRKIHERSKGRVPVVVLTALDSKETYHRARESGASYCLTKPCRPEDFLNVVDFIAGDLDPEERQLLKERLTERSCS
jgi:DNA-binding response OmpR family regulator